MLTDDEKNTYRIAFERWFKGDRAASRLCMDLLDVAHVWDDLIDKDREPSPDEIDGAFRALLIDVPGNEFYRVNSHILLPVLNSIHLQWRAANVLARDKHPGDEAKALMLKASIYQLFQTVACIVGGAAWAIETGPEVWRVYAEPNGAPNA